MEIVHKLAGYFTKFPGIGPRQAKRFVYFLLSAQPEYVEELVETIRRTRKETNRCEFCFRFFNGTGTLCALCENETRDGELLLVVEKDVDLENIEKMGVYHGTYFVLGGILPFFEKNPNEKIRARELYERVKKERAGKKVKEVIFAMSVNPEGENTTLYLSKILEPLAAGGTIKLSTLGRGLSTGTEMEYSDTETFKAALRGRGERSI